MKEIRELEKVLIEKMGYAYTAGVLFSLLQQAVGGLSVKERKALLSDIEFIKRGLV